MTHGFLSNLKMMTRRILPSNDLAFKLGYQQFTTDDDALRILTPYDCRRKKSLDREYLTIAFFEPGKG